MTNPESQGNIDEAFQSMGEIKMEQLRQIRNELANNPAELEKFKTDPTAYTKDHMSSFPEDFHVHYQEGEEMVPSELFGKPGERLALTMPISPTLSWIICIYCPIKPPK